MNLRAVVSVLILQFVAGHFDDSTCGNSKECIFVPPGCKDEGTCYQMFSYNATGDGWVDLELFSSNDQPNINYIALGFSEDDEMGNDAVTQCVFPNEGNPSAHFSYNVGKTNVPLTDPTDLAAEKDNLKLVHGHKGEDGIYCHVKQKSTKGEKRFAPDLNKPFQIFLERGQAENGRALGVHGLNPSLPTYPYIHKSKVNIAEAMEKESISSKDVSLNETAPVPTADSSFLSAKTKYWMKRVHGILMIFSWIVLIASAMLSARYLRDHFSTSTPCGLKWWFHIHRTLNLVALPFILLSTLLIWIVKDWTWRGPSVNKSAAANFSPGSVHSLLGTIAVLVAVIQPLLALLRCQPDTGARPIFNWTHRSLGILGILCAIISILIAANSFSSLWGDSAWCVGVIIFYIVTTILSITLFEVLSYMKSKAPNKATAMEMRNRGAHQFDDSGRVINSPPKIINNKPLFGIAALYVLFVLFSICVAALLIVLLSV